MRTVLSAALVALFALPVAAQQWSAEQLEVVRQLEECWDIWTAATDDPGPDMWLDRCAGDFRYWGPELSVPNDAAEARRQWNEISQNDWKWISLRPLSIQIVDDVAIMHFYGAWSRREGDGRVVDERKRTEVFHRVDGRWLLISGHSQVVGS